MARTELNEGTRLFNTRSEASRVFMRRSVLACDVLLFIPAAWACATAGAPKGSARLSFFALLCALPPLVLVDHGHFQQACMSTAHTRQVYVHGLRTVCAVCMHSMAASNAPRRLPTVTARTERPASHDALPLSQALPWGYPPSSLLHRYNCVSLGLALWAMHAAMAGRPLATCIAFSLALNFKQMSLYLAPAFFCYLLAGCVRSVARGCGAAEWRLRRGGCGLGRTRWARATAARVARLGVAVLCSFGLCWLPFLSSVEDTLTVLRRVFPVGRHLYEDKACA